MVAYKMPQQRKKEESGKLRGERYQIKLTGLRFEAARKGARRLSLRILGSGWCLPNTHFEYVTRFCLTFMCCCILIIRFVLIFLKGFRAARIEDRGNFNAKEKAQIY